MSKKLFLFFVGVVFFSSYRVVFASPIINEIMYDLDGSDIDWIEIYNPDTVDVDVTGLKLFVTNSTSNHSITQSSGSPVLHQGDYGLVVPTSQISAFTSKWGSSGNIFASSYTLPNDTGKIEINSGDKNSPLNSVAYSSTQGSSGDGKSLQLISGSWVSAVPTPGLVNQAFSGGEDTSGGGSNTDSTTTTDTTGSTSGTSGSQGGGSSKKAPSLQKMKAQILAEDVGYVGIPVKFQGLAFGLHGEQLLGGTYYWNFGDGDSRELNAYTVDAFSHTYFYPGDYDVVFEYYPNVFADKPDVSVRTSIKIVAPIVRISGVGDAQDFFVELTNDTEYDADLSGWIIGSDAKSFKVPRHTILSSKKKLVISSYLTHFTIEDKSTLKLLTPQGGLAFSYATPSVTPSIKSGVSHAQSFKKNPDIVSADQNNTVAPLIEAAALNNGVIISDTSSSSPVPIFPVLSAVFIGAGASAAYFVRKKNVLNTEGNDFTILDE